MQRIDIFAKSKFLFLKSPSTLLSEAKPWSYIADIKRYENSKKITTKTFIGNLFNKVKNIWAALLTIINQIFRKIGIVKTRNSNFDKKIIQGEPLKEAITFNSSRRRFWKG